MVGAAQGTLVARLAMLIAAAAFTVVGFILVSRRVVRPLNAIQTAMMLLR